MNNTITLEQIKKPTTQSAGLWLVKRNSNKAIIGMLEKYRNTRTDTHPWKAFKGCGPTAHYLGAFYDTGSVPDDGDTQYGGKQAAIDAITTN